MKENLPGTQEGLFDALHESELAPLKRGPVPVIASLLAELLRTLNKQVWPVVIDTR